MAEKQAKKAEAAAEETPQQHGQRQKKKSRWTMETCMKAAKRFQTREEWQHGHPSSWKAAMAKGWDGECSKHMKASAPVKAAKPVKTAKPAAKKPVKKMPKAS